MKTQILQFNNNNTKLCAEEILGGDIVAFPTETVYGLGANALNPDAVKKIYEAKGRPSDNPLICHVANVRQIDELAYITPSAQKLIDAFMPGPITIVLRKKNVPDIVTGNLDTVGIRMPNHKCALSLIEACGVPLCAPSANLSTRPSPTEAGHVLADMNGKIKYILDGGRCKVGIESTIVDCVNNTLLRRGGISEEAIENVIGKLSMPKKSDRPLCPGMKYKHYSPSAKVILALPGQDMSDRIKAVYDSEQGKKVILTLCDVYEGRNVSCIGSTVDEYAYNLFAEFRRLDSEGYDCLLCEGVSNKGVGSGLMNRLIKASGGNII